jgi:hypothetical protein
LSIVVELAVGVVYDGMLLGGEVIKDEVVYLNEQIFQ